MDNKELMATCPSCNQVIFREGEIEIKTSSIPIMTIRTICPHCRKRVKIEIKVKTEVSKDT